MAKDIPADTRAKLALVLPMLSSDQIGEVNNAARLIGRTLKAVGCDWHDLAALVKNGGGVHVVNVLHGRYAGPDPFADLKRDLDEFGARMRGMGSKAARAERATRDFASRTAAEHRAKRQPAARVGVPARDVLAVVNPIMNGGGADDNPRALTFLGQLQAKALRLDTVRLTSRQDQWLRVLARQAGVVVPWNEITEQAA